MTYLADVNVWAALALAGHVHHFTALHWFEESETDEIAFCRVTQMGLLRLLSNPTVMGKNVLTGAGAWELHDALSRDGRIGFAPEPAGLETYWRRATRRRYTGPNFWTDAYLAAFAASAGYTLVSFDRGFTQHTEVRLRLLGVR